MNIKYLLISFCFLSLSIFPQQLTNWQNYSNLKIATGVSAEGQNIWTSTTGGAFLYNLSANSFKIFNKTNGLTGSDLKTINIDNSGKIWFGNSDGIINIYDPVTDKFNVILDIYNSDRNAKGINDILVSGDTIFAATDFGISLINSDNFFFYDTYFKFGNFNSYTKVNSLSKYNLLYVSTDAGLAIQKQGAINLSAPESWNVYTTNNGLPSNSVNKIVIYNDTVFAGTDNGVAVFDGSTWNTYLPEIANTNISDFLVRDDTLYLTSNNTIRSYNAGRLQTIFTHNGTINKLYYSNSLGLIAASDDGVILLNQQNKVIIPNGPFVNQFPNMSITPNGVLWSASGTDQTGAGFYKLDKGTWTNYNTSNTPDLSTNNYYSVFAPAEDITYLGSWGKGFIEIKNRNIIKFDASNTDIQGVSDNPNFIVITGFANDSKNNLWILNFGAVNKKNLAMLTPDSTWYFFNIPAESGVYLKNHLSFAIDPYDTKWYAVTDQAKPGLYYFNENGTYTSTNDDKSGYLTTASGLNGNDISAVVVDRRGDVWIGTNLGINIITNTESILSNNQPQLGISSVFALRQYNITAIAVDPLNRKWVGTDQGLLLINEDGTGLLGSYNTKNSPIVSDNVTSISIDPVSGRVYVGTDKGLTSFDTPAIKPDENFSKLFVYPSPLVLNDDNNNQLTIDGLIRNSEIKILSITGKLINDFESPGGRVAFWDGRDMNGKLVGSGVYLIVAYDKDGNNVTTSKVAVLRK